MGDVGLQLVCNSGPRCTADLAKILFGLSTGKRGSFPIFLAFPQVSAIFLPSCRLPLLFSFLSQVFHVT